MGYKPKHSLIKTIKGLSWRTRGVALAGIAGSATLLGAAVLPGVGSAATTNICTGHCKQQQIAVPSGYNLDVSGQDAAAGTPIIAWKASTSDPAQDFTVNQVTTSSTGPASYSKNGSYGFTISDGSSAYSPGNLSSSPYSNTEASQSLGSGGVTLKINPPASPAGSCCDSGVLVDLGKLSTLFNSSGTFVPPTVSFSGASGTVFANWIFDTNNDGTPLNYNTNGQLVDAGGDNYAYSDTALTPGTNSPVSDKADFLTSLPQGTGTYFASNDRNTTMEQVQKDYADTTKAGTKTTDPEVWLNVVLYSQASASPATVSTIDGNKLVTTTGGGTTSTPTGDVQIEYTPFTNLANATAAGNTAAEAAYNTDGSAKYCVSVPQGSSHTHAVLAACSSTTALFKGVIGQDGHTLFELAGTPELALNDSGYGHNGSPIIAWAASASYWNESFWPGVNGAATS